MPKPRPRLTPEQEVLFQRMWLRGASRRAIAKVVELSLWSVSDHAKRRGLPPHKKGRRAGPGWSTEPDASLRERWAELIPEMRAAVRAEVEALVAQPSE